MWTVKWVQLLCLTIRNVSDLNSKWTTQASSDLVLECSATSGVNTCHQISQTQCTYRRMPLWRPSVVFKWLKMSMQTASTPACVGFVRISGIVGEWHGVRMKSVLPLADRTPVDQWPWSRLYPHCWEAVATCEWPVRSQLMSVRPDNLTQKRKAVQLWSDHLRHMFGRGGSETGLNRAVALTVLWAHTINELTAEWAFAGKQSDWQDWKVGVLCYRGWSASFHSLTHINIYRAVTALWHYTWAAFCGVIDRVLSRASASPHLSHARCSRCLLNMWGKEAVYFEAVIIREGGFAVASGEADFRWPIDLACSDRCGSPSPTLLFLPPSLSVSISLYLAVLSLHWVSGLGLPEASIMVPSVCRD